MRNTMLTAGIVLLLSGCGEPESLITTTGEDSSALTPAACGAVIATWNGFNAYSNGSSTGTGDSCAGRGTWGLQYQCVELVMRYFGQHWGLTWAGNAKDLLANAPRASVSVYYNGDSAHPPAPGDMIVFPAGGNVGSLGHVALVTGVGSGSVSVIQQNTAGVANGYATLPYDGSRVRGPTGWNWPDPQGWAHAHAGVSSDPCATAQYGGWYCGKSNQYNFGGGDPSTMYLCENGATQQKTVCANGCTVAPPGKNDYCN